MSKKLIHFNSDSDYQSLKDTINSHSIVFIKDSRKIVTHGKEYHALNWSILTNASLEELPDGVYAVNTNGELIDYNTANSSCLGVALIAGEHKFMIAKSDATDGTNNDFYWIKDGYSDLSLTNYDTADGINKYGYGYLGDTTSTPRLNKDFTTWTAGALSDFNGKANTAVIAAASSNAKGMCIALKTFNASDSYNDWYVPALGQLALMYLNMTEINAALEKIGGTALALFHWSSSEHGIYDAWRVSFDGGGLVGYDSKIYYSYRVRFIRDI